MAASVVKNYLLPMFKGGKKNLFANGQSIIREGKVFKSKRNSKYEQRLEAILGDG